MAGYESVNLCEERYGAVGLRAFSSLAAPAQVSSPWETTVFSLFRDAVRLNPEKVAISASGSSVKYEELWNFAAEFRGRLAASGIQSGDRVGIAAGRSVATVAAILGTMMAGACYVPLDFEDFPASMIEGLIERAGVSLWIADSDARRSEAAASWKGCPVLAIEEVAYPRDGGLTAVPEPTMDGNTALYVVFTSGSTGVPKGVVVPHRAVARLVSGQDFIHFGPEETFFLHSPLSFDASTLELWGSLLHGARLVLAPAQRLGFSETAQLLSRERVTTLWMTAAMFHLAADRSPEMFAPLRQLIFGGDVIAPRSVERIRTLYPELRMVNGYGPTENTTFTCCYVVPSNFRAEGPLPIGLPIAHTTVRVLSTDGREVSTGQEGELVAGGAGVALGYLAQPEATAERFPLDALSDRSGVRLYRTGDRVRRRQDGQIEFLGRMDRQIKIAGQRVELDAVEAAILEFPQVAEAAVVVLVPERGEKQLIACVSLASPGADSEEALRSWLSARLPRASRPHHWVLLERLPIGATGKVDRAALQAMCEARFPVSDESHKISGTRNATRDLPEALNVSGTTEHLQRLWARLLGRDSVGAEENFFDLGGTSLLLIEFHSTLKERFGVVFPLADLFDFPTPRALAERLCAIPDRREEGRRQGERRGQRQRAAILSRRESREATKMSMGRAAFPGARKDGDQ